MRSRGPLLLALVAMAVATVAMALPFVTRNRDFPSSIPSPAPLFQTDVVDVAAGQSACFRYAVVEQHSREARFQTASGGGSGPPLRLLLRGPGYSRAVEIAGGYPPGTEHRVPVDPPARPTPLRVCIENRGHRSVGLYASVDRTRSRSLATVAGRPAHASIVFGFWERGVVDVRRRLPAIAERITIFRPAFVGRWLVWALGILLLAGIPAAVLSALWTVSAPLQQESARSQARNSSPPRSGAK